MTEMPQQSSRTIGTVRSSRLKSQLWLVLPCLTGALQWMSYYPLGWGFLSWIALVPLLFLVRLDTKPWKIYIGAFFGGCFFFWPVLAWMTVADYRMVYLWGMLATYCALYYPLALFLIRRLDRATHWPLTITVPLVWTGLEYLRSFFGTGFAWYFLGHTQHHYLEVIQAADLGGVYVISFVVAAVNGWLAEFLLTWPEVRIATVQVGAPSRVIRRYGLAVLGLVIALLFYGMWRLSQDRFLPGPRVALLQGNLDQRILNDASAPGANAFETSEKITDYYWELCRRAFTVVVPSPDLIVWPETSFPYTWLELPQDLNKIQAVKKEQARLVQNLVGGMARTSKTNHLIGLNCRVLTDKGVSPYNSALLVTKEGSATTRYDKKHRVPFGEYVPLRGWIPFMDYFAPYDFDYSIRAGDHLTRFQLDKFHFGVLICYEDTDPFLARQYNREQTDGPPVDFLLNISNDGWFDGSSQHAEHLAISRFRAIESRRALARSVNMGISAVIDSNGRVQEPKELTEVGGAKMWGVEPDRQGKIPDLPEGHWKDFTKVQGVLTATIPIDNRLSIYAVTGDWLPLGCWIVLGGVWVWRKVGRRSV